MRGANVEGREVKVLPVVIIQLQRRRFYYGSLFLSLSLFLHRRRESKCKAGLGKARDQQRDELGAAPAGRVTPSTPVVINIIEKERA